MEPLYLYHLKSRTLADVDWYKLFKNWSLQSSNIIEIQSELSCIYPSDYIFNDREYRAWRSLIKAAGGTNITPFNKKESLVLQFIKINHFKNLYININISTFIYNF